MLLVLVLILSEASIVSEYEVLVLDSSTALDLSYKWMKVNSKTIITVAKHSSFQDVVVQVVALIHSKVSIDAELVEK